MSSNEKEKVESKIKKIAKQLNIKETPMCSVLNSALRAITAKENEKAMFEVQLEEERKKTLLMQEDCEKLSDSSNDEETMVDILQCEGRAEYGSKRLKMATATSSRGRIFSIENEQPEEGSSA
ncbi:hypothetical protein Btru_068084 [Bulinus truncatus]|nr:hypothetical protein Btru_068084 [Bulinus truncatus]